MMIFTQHNVCDINFDRDKDSNFASCNFFVVWKRNCAYIF